MHVNRESQFLCLCCNKTFSSSVWDYCVNRNYDNQCNDDRQMFRTVTV